jgi:hypothetical protein
MSEIKIQEHICGCLDDVSPIRTYDYMTAVKNNVAIEDNFPSSFVLNNEEMGLEVKDQGTVGACVACGLATVMEAYYKEIMSEGWNYGYLRDSDSDGYGMSVIKALQYAKEKGGLPKTYLDILKEMPGMKTIVNDLSEFNDIAKKYTISNWVSINTAIRKNKDLQIKDALTKYRIPLLCVCPRGVFSSKEAHCLTLVGWDDKEDVYILKNSWGNTNNKQGLVRQSKKDIGEVFLIFADPIDLPFTDVSKDDWFYESVKDCYMSGIMNGKTIDSFDPNAPMTRAEIATVMSRIMKKIDDRIIGLKDLIEWEAKTKKLDQMKTL